MAAGRRTIGSECQDTADSPCDTLCAEVNFVDCQVDFVTCRMTLRRQFYQPSDQCFECLLGWTHWIEPLPASSHLDCQGYHRQVLPWSPLRRLPYFEGLARFGVPIRPGAPRFECPNNTCQIQPDPGRTCHRVSRCATCTFCPGDCADHYVVNSHCHARGTHQTHDVATISHNLGASNEPWCHHINDQRQPRNCLRDFPLPRHQT